MQLQSQQPVNVFYAEEVRVSVPLDLRKRVEDDLEQILPGMSWKLQERLPEIGLTVAPILARGLANYDLHRRASPLLFFRSFPYEPVIPVLIQLAPDRTKGLFGKVPPHGYQLKYGEVAVWVLDEMAQTSDRARAGLISVLSTQQFPRQFLDWLRPWRLLGDDFKPYRRGKRPSKRAKNTV